MRPRDTPEEREAKLEYFYDAVANPNTRQRVSFHIRAMHEGDPPVAPADVQAAQGYLKACILNMSLAELDLKTQDDLAALWARGSIGAAQYRMRRRERS
jgi:hypothetical protein